MLTRKFKRVIAASVLAFPTLFYASQIKAQDTIDEELKEYFSKRPTLTDYRNIKLDSLLEDFNKKFLREVKKDGIEPGLGYFDFAPDQYKERSLPDLNFSLFEKETNDLIKKRIEGTSKNSLEEYLRRTDVFLRLKQFYEGITKFNISKKKDEETKIEIPSIKRELSQSDIEREYIERELKRIRAKDFGLSLYDRKREIDLEAALDRLNEDDRKVFSYKFKFGADANLGFSANEFRDFNLVLEPLAELKTNLFDAKVSYPFSLKSDNFDIDNINDELKIRISKTIITRFGRLFLNLDNSYRIKEELNKSSISLSTRLRDFDFKAEYSRDWKNKDDIFSISSTHFITDRTNVELRSILNTKGDYAILGILNFNVNPEYFFRDLNERLRLKK